MNILILIPLITCYGSLYAHKGGPGVDQSGLNIHFQGRIIPKEEIQAYMDKANKNEAPPSLKLIRKNWEKE